MSDDQAISAAARDNSAEHAAPDNEKALGPFPSRRLPEACWALFWTFIFFWLWIPAPLWGKAIALAWFALAAVSPGAFWITLAFALPWFGKDPGGPKPLYVLDMGLMGLVACESLARAVSPIPRRLGRLNPWISIFVILSVASAQSCLWALEPEFSLGPLGFLHRIFEHYATAEVYGLRLSIGLALAWGVYRVARDRPWPQILQERWTWALLAGLGLSFALGLLDYFGVASLEWWRPLNPDVVRFGYARLMSTFWHSGWYAEYVSALAPVLLALAWHARRPAAKVGWLCFALLSFFVMLITFQRAGWLAVIAGNAAVIMGLCLMESKGAWAGRFFKILALFILLVLIAGGALAALSPDFRHRAGELLVYEDRTLIWRSALKMWWPGCIWGGVGYGFYYHYHLAAYPYGHPYYILDKVNAHNLYVNTLVERGLPALILLLTIIGAALRRLWPSKRIYAADAALGQGGGVRSALRLGIFGGVVATLVQGIFQDPFYIRLMAALWWIWLGWTAWMVAPASPRALRRHVWLAALALVVFLAALVQENLWRYPSLLM